MQRFILFLCALVLILMSCTPYVLAKEVTVGQDPYSGGLEAKTTFSPDMTPDQIEAISSVQEKQLKFAYSIYTAEKATQKAADNNSLARMVIKYAVILIAFVVIWALRKGKQPTAAPLITEEQPAPSLKKEILQAVERRMS